MRITAAPRVSKPPESSSGWRSSDRRKRLPKDWRKRRRAVLDRDNWACQVCGAEATEVDHIGDPGDHSPGNLRSMCRGCHMSRTQAQAAAARRAKGSYVTRRRQPERHPGIID